MAGGEAAGSRQLDQTPTWAVSSVCAIIIVISIILEKVLHHFGEFFRGKKKKALNEALEKIKNELMVLGFISLILTFGQNYISKVCIPERLANTMLPCALGGNQHYTSAHSSTHGVGHQAYASIYEEAARQYAAQLHKPEFSHNPSGGAKEEFHRRLLWLEHRILAADSPFSGCKQGYLPLITVNGLHQLHIFIFFLAVFHVIYSCITMALGRLKIRGWKYWERDTVSEHDAMNDPGLFRLTHEISFVKDHNSFWTKTPILSYIVFFLRQFSRSVHKADYLTMRHGFISVHISPGSKFDFQKYIKRSLEDDFKVVVGISPVLWASVVLFLLLNVDGWQAMFWVSILPLVVTLAVGTKLQAIIARMAHAIQEKHAVVQGIPLVHVSDQHFWFSWPPLVLYLIHFVLFQNAFELTFFLWIWYEFGLQSCFHSNFTFVIVRVCLGIGAQFLCSYSTLPLYALVTQMGSTMKKSIFDEQTAKALRQWHKKAMKKKTEGGGEMGIRVIGGCRLNQTLPHPNNVDGLSQQTIIELDGNQQQPHQRNDNSGFSNLHSEP